MGARLLRNFVDSLPAGSGPVEVWLGQSAVTPADVESPDSLAVPVYRGAEAAERLGEGEDPVEGSALCVDQREVVVRVAVRVADEGARHGWAEGGGGPLVEDDGALACDGGGGVYG